MLSFISVRFIVNQRPDVDPTTGTGGRLSWREACRPFVALSRRRRLRRAERDLECLDDHMLKDIGISRSE
jgi:uncharacterized protein YjiS (DUF1127 family)